MASPPRSVTSAVAASVRDGETSVTTTCAPCSAKSRALSRPSPEPAPVMRTTFPASRMAASLSCLPGLLRDISRATTRRTVARPVGCRSRRRSLAARGQLRSSRQAGSGSPGCADRASARQTGCDTSARTATGPGSRPGCTCRQPDGRRIPGNRAPASCGTPAGSSCRSTTDDGTPAATSCSTISDESRERAPAREFGIDRVMVAAATVETSRTPDRSAHSGSPRAVRSAAHCPSVATEIITQRSGWPSGSGSARAIGPLRRRTPGAIADPAQQLAVGRVLDDLLGSRD